MGSSVEVPKQHKACVYDKPGSTSTKVEMIATPEPGPAEVLVNLTHSGVCHSDYGIMMNSWAGLPYPTQAGQVGGHEGVGVVAKLGPGAETTGIKIGDRVGIKWISRACGSCLACLEGYDGVCFNQSISGYYTPGTFQQYAIGPANYVTPIPDALSSADAAPMLCAGVTTYSALRRSNARSGQWVVIAGAGGGLGHIACQIASRGMALRVIGVDAAAKKDLALQSGAEHFVDAMAHDDESIKAEVLKLTGGLGASAVIVCTASNKAYEQAMGFLRFGGTLVCVGMPEGDPKPIGSAYPAAMCTKMLSITSVAVGNRKEAAEVLEMAARGIVKTHYRLEKMENLTKVFEEMGEGKLQGRVVLEMS